MAVKKEFSIDPNIVLHDSITATRSNKDAKTPLFKLNQKVKLKEDVVNDGTYPHASIGTLMMPKGAVGYIKDMGDFLQVIRVYEVHFIKTNMEVEIIGCREHELEAIDDACDNDTTQSPLFKKIIEQRRKKQS